MSTDDVERRLREAFEAGARASIDDVRPVPPPRFATQPARGRHRSRLLAPLAAAAAVVAVVGGILAVARDTGGHSGGPAIAGGTAAHSSTPSSTWAKSQPIAPPNATQAPKRSVHIRLFNGDGKVYGVAMPVVAIFSSRITDARPFAHATQVSVNGRPIEAAWYFQQSPSGLGAMEAHLRPKAYWPAHAQVHVSLATKGLSAGSGLAFDDALTLDFSTGPRTIAVVDDRSHRMTVMSDGSAVAVVPVSLGMAKTPTMSGTKVIMAQDRMVKLSGPGFANEAAPYAQQLTYSGEYIIGAPWNEANIKAGVDVSNGCTNLRVSDAAHLYKLLRVGDPVEFPNTSGAQVPPWDGFGDWNVPWATWKAGGLLKTS